MSDWTKIKIEDCEIDEQELIIDLGNDDFGENYLTIDLSELEQLIYKYRLTH